MPKLTPQQIHSIKDLRSFFAAIPDERWCVGGDWLLSNNRDKMCALGHLSERNGMPTNYPNIYTYGDKVLSPLGISRTAMWRKNDDTYDIINGHTPRLRVLTLLDEHLEKGSQ